MDIRKLFQTRPKPEPRSTIPDWVVNVVVLLFGITTIAQPFVIPSSSMEETLLIGDHVIVDKLVYSPPGSLTRHLFPYSDVKRGDIIVFRYPIDTRMNYVKRCMGVPGDRIHIENKQVFVNGKKLDEPYKYHKTSYVLAYRDNFPSGRPEMSLYPPAEEMLKNNVANGELVVPPGHYFAMGDNRDNSLDSRYWGFVPRENIIGKPVVIFWSYDAPTEHLAGGNINVDHLLDMALHFFTKTRWSRTFKLVRGD